MSRLAGVKAQAADNKYKGNCRSSLCSHIEARLTGTVAADAAAQMSTLLFPPNAQVTQSNNQSLGAEDPDEAVHGALLSSGHQKYHCSYFLREIICLAHRYGTSSFATSRPERTGPTVPYAELCPVHAPILDPID